MRYLTAFLALLCVSTLANACGKRKAKGYPVATATVKTAAAVVTAPVKAVRTIVCNGQTCTIVK